LHNDIGCLIVGEEPTQSQEMVEATRLPDRCWMKRENRRYNKDETSKEFYIRKKNEMNKVLESKAWKAWSEKIWAEYKKVNNDLSNNTKR